jgi:hypothetical protein
VKGGGSATGLAGRCSGWVGGAGAVGGGAVEGGGVGVCVGAAEEGT